MEVAVLPTRDTGPPSWLHVLASVETQKVTDPVGAGKPDGPVTVAVSWMLWPKVMLVEFSEVVTIGVTICGMTLLTIRGSAVSSLWELK